VCTPLFFQKHISSDFLSVVFFLSLGSGCPLGNEGVWGWLLVCASSTFVVFVSCVSFFLVSGLNGVVVPVFVYELHCLLGGSLARVVCVSCVSLFLVFFSSGMVSFSRLRTTPGVCAWEFSRDV